ncbi:MAG TPA: AAA family ATPase [Acidimicrobiales bacterium]
MGVRPGQLANRDAERRVLVDLLEAVRGGESRSLVVHGDSGVGKTALLEYLVGEARDCQVVRSAGVQSEMELAFAGLHQLCAPVLDHLELVPEPQRDALKTTFGITQGAVPDRFLLGLAVLSLLSEAADKRPLVCLIDDAQWLDGASSQVLGFVARRLGAESLGLVFAARIPNQELAGLPGLLVQGLAEDAARKLLDSVLSAPLDAQVRDRIIIETGGNPLALLELPRGLTAGELAGGFGLPGAVALSQSIEESFRRRVEALPLDTQRLLLVAAAEPVGDLGLLWRAAERLGIDAAAAKPTHQADLVEFSNGVRFHHPLVRSAVYRSASAEERQNVHRALADATDEALDPDRRAWHRAQSSAVPDENVAAELESSAGRARARGGMAAAAAFLERATRLTPDPTQRAIRAITAAEAKVGAGALRDAMDLLAIALAGPLNELQRARVDLMQARLAFVMSRGNDAPLLLVKAAKRLETTDPNLARATYRDAMIAALFAGRLASPGADVPAVAEAAGQAGGGTDLGNEADLLIAGLAASFNHGYISGLEILRRAVVSFGDGMSPDEELRWLPLAYVATMHIRSEERWLALSERWARLSRELGALSELPLALSARAQVLVMAGDLAAATALVDEIQVAVEATEIQFPPYGALCVASFSGHEAEASRLIEATLNHASLRGQGLAISAAEWARAVLNNGFSRYEDALRAALRATEDRWGVGFANWALVELIEAAARTGNRDTAAETYERLTEVTDQRSDWAAGVHARAHALLIDGNEAERLYLESIERLGRTPLRTELARAHLVYGEWLRRQRRRTDARSELRVAHDMLVEIGMEAFAERARRELLATGETARKRDVGSTTVLTPQEAQVARMAGEGLSNPEIGARLFISARTVQYHLSKVFAKLDITSRGQLHRVLH